MQHEQLAINWIAPQRVVRQSAKSRFAIRISKTRSGESRRHSVFTLYEPLMIEMRFQCGDRFLVGETETHIALKRASGGVAGFLSGPGGKGGEEREKLLGTTCMTSFRLTSDLVKEQREYTREELTILDDGTILIPKNT